MFPLNFETFFLAFIPLFVALNALGTIPVFLTLTNGMDPVDKSKLITQASLTALSVGLIFLILGKLLFGFLGITDNDFRVGGGLVLLMISIRDLLAPNDPRRKVTPNLGVVPIGVPLIMGPGTMTTILIVADTQGPWICSAALLVNIAIVWMLFKNSNHIVRLMGENGTRAFSKVASLFLAAIAIKMIRFGVEGFLHG